MSKALAFTLILNSQYFFKPRKGMGSSPIRTSLWNGSVERQGPITTVTPPLIVVRNLVVCVLSHAFEIKLLEQLTAWKDKHMVR